MTTIRPATSATDLAAVRALCWDYRSYLMSVSEIDNQITQTFYPAPKYTALMDALETAHARPLGQILLATQDGTPAGCAMTHALDSDTAEIKRLYVTPQARGHGIARKLVEALMAQARADGYTRIVLDTSVNLSAARALYASMGFTQRAPYQTIPPKVLPHLVFFEAPL